MKTKKFSKKLSLNKETIANLDHAKMRNIQGGVDAQADKLSDNPQVYLCKLLTPHTCHPNMSCLSDCAAGSCFAECYITEFCGLNPAEPGDVTAPVGTA